MPMETTHRERKIADITKRLDLLYDTISEIESCLDDANLRKESIEKERVTVEKIYEMLKTFGAFYDIMTEEERRDLVSYLIKEVQIYPNDGVGTRLLTHFEKKAKEKGAHKLIVEEVYDWNVGFFLKNGYNVAGELSDLPKDHVYYVLDKDL